jgi:hypothetical protein
MSSLITIPRRPGPVREPMGIFCLHMEMGRTEIPKTCIHNYECQHCSFDQWLERFEGGAGIQEGMSRPTDISGRPV